MSRLFFCLFFFTPRLSTPPSTLDDLGDSIRLLEQMQNQVPQVERQFEPLQDQFNMLGKYEVAIPEEVRRVRETEKEGERGRIRESFHVCLHVFLCS